MIDWIKVNDRLPDHGKNLWPRQLCITSSGLIAIGYYFLNFDDDNFDWQMEIYAKSFKDMGYEVTHWMPLPERPID